MQSSFKALVLEQQENGPVASIRELTNEDLPAGDVLVQVEYSSLNYKDGMILNGRGGLVRHYPHVAGIDLAGTVLESSDPRHRPGDAVILTGHRVGETHWGGYAQRARLHGDWLIPRPAGYSARQAMAAGTAGLTAMLAVQALDDHGLHPDAGKVLVTGASGGVGSLAVRLLARLGYTVAAVTGRRENVNYLHQLGAQEVLPREELATGPAKPLLSERWAGCVDTVGGDTLAHVLAGMAYGRSVAACGLAGGAELHTTVLPFLLRGISLLGIDSVLCPADRRLAAWERLGETLPGPELDAITHEIGLDEVPAHAERILQGQVRGRVVVRLDPDDR
ncbi:MDR family oxidoreductase [Thioalkalivibrio sp. ALJ24]|uniref:MDR family oxidoreductase n=1 Tax=Thioalkalivibrio sp. ALJ24 TaxID=545276 RepID=UPI00037E841E|nr:MDR family oxidoreductase [Thioalkalivibrio sp. ALJ24]